MQFAISKPSSETNYCSRNIFHKYQWTQMDYKEIFVQLEKCASYNHFTDHFKLLLNLPRIVLKAEAEKASALAR